MANYEEYINKILADYLSSPNGEKFFKSFAQTSEDVLLNGQEARKEGMSQECANDTLGEHFNNGYAIMSPFETSLQARQYLSGLFEKWKKNGSVEGLLDELKRFGITRAKVWTWKDLVEAGVPSAFGGNYTKIVGIDPNGGVWYLINGEKGKPGYTIQHKIVGPNHPLTVILNETTQTITVELETDGLNSPVSRAIDIFNKFYNDPELQKYVFVCYQGTGNGIAAPSLVIEMQFSYYTYFIIDVYEPHPFADITSSLLWNDNTTDYCTYKTGPYHTFWYPFPYINPTATLLSIWGTDSSFIWICGEVAGLGFVALYDGLSWVIKFSAIPIIPFAIYGTSPIDIWVAGTGTTVYRYDGISFISVPTPGRVGIITTITGSAGNAIFMGSSSGEIYFYDGATLSLQATIPLLIQQMYSASATDVIAVGNTGSYHYNGVSWTSVAVPMGVGSLLAVHGLSASLAYAGGTGGKLIRWNGTSWSTVVTVPTLSKITAIYCLSPTEIYVFGTVPENNDHIPVMYIYDGAISVQLTQMKDFPPYLGQAIVFSPSEAWSISGNKIQKYQSLITGTFKQKTTLDMMPVHDVHGTSTASSVYLVQGDAGTGSVYKWNGTTFVKDMTAPSIEYQAVFARTDTDVWFCGMNGKIYQFDGMMWTDFSHLTKNWYGIWADANFVYVVGGDGMGDGSYSVYDRAMMSWTDYTIVGSDDLSDVTQTANTKIYTTATGGFVYEISGAMAVDTLYPGTGSPFRIFSPPNSDVIYITDLGSDLYFYSPMATTPWDILPFTSTDPLFDVSGSSFNSIWVTTGMGKYKYYDGTTIQEYTDPDLPDNTIHRVFSNEYNSAFAGSLPAMGVNALGYKLEADTTTLPCGATGLLWNDNHYWDGLSPSQGFVSILREVIRRAKPSTMSCRFLRVFNGTKATPYPIADKWEEDADGNIVDFYTTHY